MGCGRIVTAHGGIVTAHGGIVTAHGRIVTAHGVWPHCDCGCERSVTAGVSALCLNGALCDQCIV